MGIMSTAGDRQSDEALLAGLGAGDAELAVAFVRQLLTRFEEVA